AQGVRNYWHPERTSPVAQPAKQKTGGERPQSVREMPWARTMKAAKQQTCQQQSKLRLNYTQEKDLLTKAGGSCYQHNICQSESGKKGCHLFKNNLAQGSYPLGRVFNNFAKPDDKKATSGGATSCQDSNNGSLLGKLEGRNKLYLRHLHPESGHEK